MFHKCLQLKCDISYTIRAQVLELKYNISLVHEITHSLLYTFSYFLSFFLFWFFFLVFNDYWKLIRSYNGKLGLACFPEITIGSGSPPLIQNIYLLWGTDQAYISGPSFLPSGYSALLIESRGLKPWSQSLEGHEFVGFEGWKGGRFQGLTKMLEKIQW